MLYFKRGDGMNKFKVGDVVEGIVTGVQSYGAFLSFADHYTGLVHISEISEGYVKEITQFVDVGQMVKVRIIEIDHENKHLKLSLKALNKQYKRKEKREMWRKYRRGIQETPKGFQPLQELLPIWIEKALINREDL